MKTATRTISLMSVMLFVAFFAGISHAASVKGKVKTVFARPVPACDVLKALNIPGPETGCALKGEFPPVIVIEGGSIDITKNRMVVVRFSGFGRTKAIARVMGRVQEGDAEALSKLITGQQGVLLWSSEDGGLVALCAGKPFRHPVAAGDRAVLKIKRAVRAVEGC